MSASELKAELSGAEDKRAALSSHAEKMATLRASLAQSRAEASAAKAQATALRSEAEAAAAAAPAKEDAPKEEEGQPAPAAEAPADGPAAQYGRFVQERAKVYQQLAMINAAFEYGASVAESDVRAASLDTVFDACEEFIKDSFNAEIAKSIDDLAKQGEALQADGADVNSLDDAKAKLESASKLYDTHSKGWFRESTRRRSREKLMAEFEENWTPLINWCRQQAAKLGNLAEPDHVQEFCASFYDRSAVMEANFLVLMEMSETVLPSPEVEAKLMELAEVWLGVAMLAFEKLRATLLDLHAKSGLEGAARQWPEFSDRFGKFLSDSKRILSIPTDDESVSVAAPLKDSCNRLQANSEPHRLIVAHLSDFALREECLKEHYNAIRKAAFSKLTLMTQAFPGLFTYPRKREYTDRTAELADWIEAKSRKQPWMDLLARVDRMKRLIEDNELTLANAEERV